MANGDETKEFQITLGGDGEGGNIFIASERNRPEGPTKVWGKGQTPAEAVANLFSKSPELEGNVTWAEEGDEFYSPTDQNTTAEGEMERLKRESGMGETLR